MTQSSMPWRRGLEKVGGGSWMAFGWDVSMSQKRTEPCVRQIGESVSFHCVLRHIGFTRRSASKLPAAAHFALEWTVMIGDWSIPMWVSWIALVVAGGRFTTAQAERASTVRRAARAVRQ